jgi:hypothetical protein
MRDMNRKALIAMCFGLALPAAAGESKSRSADLQSTRATLARWVETQEITSRERKAWQQSKEVLTSRIDMLRREISLVEEQLAKARTERSGADTARAEVVSQRDALLDTTRRLGGHLDELEGKARRLYEGLPAVLTEKVKPLHDRMPGGDAAGSSLSLAERFQNVLGILSELNRLNSEVTVATEIRPLSDGRPSEVRTIYLGLAQAYYVSAGGEAGIGRPSPAGWTWQADASLAQKINDVLEVLQNKASPRFVPLPVTLD